MNDENPSKIHDRSAAQPASASNASSDQSSSETHDRSAARPASELNAYEELCSLQDCDDWLNTIPAQEITQSKPLQRLQSATTILQKRSSRQQREEVQPLLQHWGVPQKARKRKRSHDEIKVELLAKVIEETRRLKRMQIASATTDPHDYAGTSGATFSAIAASFQNASAKR